MSGPRLAPSDSADLAGRTILVTGATGGLGSALASRLSSRGATLILAARDRARAEEVSSALPGPASWLPVDLTDLASLARVANRTDAPLDHLIHCAGVVPSWRPQRAMGRIDPTLAVNFLGPFALTSGLLPNIRGRVVTVGSIRHRASRLTAARVPPRPRLFDPQRAYADSKLAVTSWAFELDRRIARAGWATRSVVAHPGWVNTGFIDPTVPAPIRPLVNSLAHRWAHPLERGVAALEAALDADLTRGTWIGPGDADGPPAVGQTSARATDPSLAEALWDWAQETTGVSYPVPPAQPSSAPGSG